MLKVANLTKQFADVRAVDDLSFAVEPGEIYGFLGGNGAGKTTTLRMVLDIIRPTSGTIEVMGSAPDRRASGAIGFLPEERGLYGNMTVIAMNAYYGQHKQMRAGDARAHGMELLERFDLADRAKAKVADLSKGMAQKVQLATALVNRPRLLILDEPFSGLDPVNQGLLEDEILRAAGTGAAVIFSTHVMQHAERLCERILLLRKGRKRFEGTIAEARHEQDIGKAHARVSSMDGSLPTSATNTSCSEARCSSKRRSGKPCAVQASSRSPASTPGASCNDHARQPSPRSLTGSAAAIPDIVAI
ncbi:ATP-binding cassette domain-containing protein, partial [Erythrobacter sp. T5W1-R]